MLLKEQRYTSLDVIEESTHSPDVDGDSEFFNLIKPLTDDEKILFTLKYIYEYQNNEIAELLGRKTGTVKSQISRAMEKLK
jgi:RNA polymerase sigma-70 factor (ECF subfamily)